MKKIIYIILSSLASSIDATIFVSPDRPTYSDIECKQTIKYSLGEKGELPIVRACPGACKRLGGTLQEVIVSENYTKECVCTITKSCFCQMQDQQRPHCDYAYQELLKQKKVNAQEMPQNTFLDLCLTAINKECAQNSNYVPQNIVQDMEKALQSKP